MFDKRLIHDPAGILHYTGNSNDTRQPEPFQTLALHPRIGIDHPGVHPCHPSLDQGVGAGGGLAEVGAGLEGDINIGVPGTLSGPGQGMNLRMGGPGTFMSPLADN